MQKPYAKRSTSIECMLDGSIWVREDLKWDETTQNGKGNRLLFSDFRSDDYQIWFKPHFGSVWVRFGIDRKRRIKGINAF